MAIDMASPVFERADEVEERLVDLTIAPTIYDESFHFALEGVSAGEKVYVMKNSHDVAVRKDGKWIRFKQK
jgi:hypothetical protein